MIKEGGDTDTNACIVGGMLGALVGYNGLPADMCRKVVEFDCVTGGGRARPEFLSTKRHLLNNVDVLIKIRP